MIYIMNTPILTEYGSYEFSKINLDDAEHLLLHSKFVSAIGHEATAKLMSMLTSVEIPVNRISIKMLKGDFAIVFRLLQRLPEGKVLSIEELKKIPFEFALLKKIN